MKKLKFLVLFLCMAVLFSVAVFAATYGDLTYSISNGKITITDCKISASGKLIIPAEISSMPVTSIGDGAFEFCNNFTSITIPDSVTSIGERAFDSCRNLKSITIPSSVTSIGDYAFDRCAGLKSAGPIGIGCNIEFGWTTTIPANAFYGCSGLTSITIPKSVTTIGKRAFNNCGGLTSITVDSANLNYCSIDGVLFDKQVHTLIQYPSGSAQTSYVIADSVTSIGDYAFGYCKNLTSIMIPKGVTSIGDRAFVYCNNLTSITIPEGVTSIGDCAFGNCINLTSITIPKGVTSIGYMTFFSCNSLTSVTIPDSVTTIGEGAFMSCSGLTNVKIPSSVTSIGEGAFTSCSGLTSLTIPGGLTSIGDWAFYKCSNLTGITIYSTNADICDSEYTFGSHSPDLIFTCYKGSTAEAYATKYGISVRYLCQTHDFSVLVSAEIPAMAYTNGKTAVYKCANCDATVGGEIIHALLYDSFDFDGDGEVEVTDVLFSLRDLLNGGTDGLPDTNGDGKFTLIDVLRLLKLCVK